LFLELLSSVDTVVFDKTGTLTHGRPEVVAVSCLGGASEQEILEIAGCAESVSEHPLGKAIIAKAQQNNLVLKRPDHFSYIPGRGITCSLEDKAILVGNRKLFEQNDYELSALGAGRSDTSEVLVGKCGNLLGAIHIADILRPEAQQAVSDLQAMGIDCVLLTGDSKSIAKAVATQLGITEVAAEVLPDEKQGYIKTLMTSGKRVAMLGDGVNDALALMEATVGVAIGSGTDVARESANIVLIGNDLGRFVETVRIARRCKGIIITNFVGTIAVDGLGVLLAAFGFLNPLLAAFIHVTSELVFILNSARLLPGRATKQ
jgi:P-type E1-E2 ATPase